MKKEFKLISKDLIKENKAKLKSLFPETDKDGEIDVVSLLSLLGVDNEEQNECFGLNWAGKKEAKKIALKPTTATLRPVKRLSNAWDTTKNIFIEGDNLEVLKVLQKSYSTKVKLIYIDPPYNTGKDFVYSDNYNDNLRNYLEKTKQFENGERLTTNIEKSGRYHANWLNMIYPRLSLARNLLRQDGAIFISIDDNEYDNLKKVCDEIFGEDNFVASVIWHKKYTRSNDASWFSNNHDYILVYAKNKDYFTLNNQERDESQLKAYRNPDNHPKGVWKATPLHAKSGTNNSSFTFKNGVVWAPPKGTYRRFNDESMKKMDENEEIWFGENGKQIPQRKSFLSEVKDGVVPVTIWTYQEVGHTHEANNDLKNLSLGGVFDNPKPVKLLRRILDLAIQSDEDLVLDFFAGSGTTGHAVLEKNLAEKKNVRYICVQLPEPIKDKKYQKISDFTINRLLKAGEMLKNESSDWVGDIGFRVFKLDTSNIRPWEATAETLSEQLDAYVSPILEGRSEEDLLTELMLKRGIDLSVNVETRQFDGLTVSCVDGGKLFTCFTRQIPASSIEVLTKGIIDWHKSLKAGKDTVCYFLDDAFENNVAKTNLCAILEQHGLTNLHSL
ncbi:type III restriction-modification system methylation subunit [Klebsiella pneumoniae]|nr:type III restriction-modification system methylation subunit [Klebsiella pneumoniae]